MASDLDSGRHGTFRDVGIDAVGVAAGIALVQRQAIEGLAIIEAARSRLQCPACQSTRLYQSQRRGFLAAVVATHPPGPFSV